MPSPFEVIEVPRVLDLAQVKRNRPVARDTVILELAVELPAPPAPGQFAMVHPLREGCLLPRPFSILDHRDGEMDLLVKVVGRGSAALAQLQTGDRVRVLAPLGSSFDHPALLQEKAIFVAGGVGVVPLHWLARRLASTTEPVCLFGARTPQDLPRELLAEVPAWELWVESDPTDDCRRGLVTVGLQEALAKHPGAAVATCGPTAMMAEVARLATAAGRRVWVCLEEQMGCGSGVCRACVLPHADGSRMRTVCREGPVFALDEIQFEGVSRREAP